MKKYLYALCMFAVPLMGEECVQSLDKLVAEVNKSVESYNDLTDHEALEVLQKVGNFLLQEFSDFEKPLAREISANRYSPAVIFLRCQTGFSLEDCREAVQKSRLRRMIYSVSGYKNIVDELQETHDQIQGLRSEEKILHDKLDEVESTLVQATDLFRSKGLLGCRKLKTYSRTVGAFKRAIQREKLFADKKDTLQILIGRLQRQLECDSLPRAKPVLTRVYELARSADSK